MPEQLEAIPKVQDMSAAEMGQFIIDFTKEARAVLNERRVKRYEEECVALDAELTTLAAESDEIQAQAVAVISRMGSAERVLQFQYDQLIVQRKNEEAKAKLDELEQIKAGPAKIEKLRREIEERAEQIEGEKRTALRRGAEAFREASFTLIRGGETGLASNLDAVRDILNSLEMQVGVSLYQPAELTSPEKSNEWFTLNRLYRGRG